MCDTIVATGEATVDGTTVFGKNSDREPNEAHHLLNVPAADHPPGSRVKCTYIDIPQVEHTYAVLLAKPFWIWGAEMGANEHGVAIGNEAVFAKVPYHKKNDTLIGMDLLRLGLERGSTAREALTVMTELLAEYGQGGNCGFRHKFFYHNSFIIADPHDAWVFETAGLHWAAKQIRGVYTISNGITIGTEWDLASPELVSHAIEKGWCKGRDDFHFARCYSDFIFTTFSYCRSRRARTMELLKSQDGKLTPGSFVAILRDHGESVDDGWRPDRSPLTGAMVCMHASLGPIRGSETKGSMVSHLHPDHATHFLTGSSAPCTGIFKPFWLDAQLPDMGPAPRGTYDPGTLFWRHEALYRATLRDYATRTRLYQEERDELEQRFMAGALDYASGSAAERTAFSTKCLAEADAAEVRWLEQVSDARVQARQNQLHAVAWSGFNRQAHMPAGGADESGR